MVYEKTTLKRISNELDNVILETIEKVTPFLREMDVLSKDEKVSYVAASRMISLKVKKYLIPFTTEVIKEIAKIVKENGGKK